MLMCSLLCIAPKGKLVTGITPAMINYTKALKTQPINGRVGGNKAQGERVMHEIILGSLLSNQLCKLRLAGVQLGTHWFPLPETVEPHMFPA